MDKPIFTLPSKKKYRNITLDKFLEFLNPPRIEQGYKPISYGRLSKILGEMKLDSWGKSIFLGTCLDSKNPSAFFWFKYKSKK